MSADEEQLPENGEYAIAFVKEVRTGDGDETVFTLDLDGTRYTVRGSGDELPDAATTYPSVTTVEDLEGERVPVVRTPDGSVVFDEFEPVSGVSVFRKRNKDRLWMAIQRQNVDRRQKNGHYRARGAYEAYVEEVDSVTRWLAGGTLAFTIGGAVSVFAEAGSLMLGSALFGVGLLLYFVRFRVAHALVTRFER